MRFTPLNFLAALLVVEGTSAAVVLPRTPKGGSGGGGGGRGGGGGSRGSSGGDSSGGGGAPIGLAGTGSSRGGSGGTGYTAISNFGGGTGSRSANYFSQGGGQRLVTSQSSVFKGREFGGGVRSEVSGTRAYGSGYPYTSASIVTYGVVNQPFPFGFWPIYWGGHGRSYQYGGNSTVDAQRPGGDQVLIQLLPATTGNWNTTTINGTAESYWMIGDKESVTALFTVLSDTHSSSQYGCDVLSASPIAFNPTDPATPVHFENVLQWYRASSFALAFQGYNNSYALPPLNETANLGWNDATPLPTAIQYSPFLKCINNTITAAVPILDSDAAPPLSTVAIVCIVVGSVVGAILIGVPLFTFTRKRLRQRKYTKMDQDPPKVVIDSASDVYHTKVETSDTDAGSVLGPPAYSVDDKPSTSHSPLLSPYSFPTPLVDSGETSPFFPSPHRDTRAGGTGQELAYSSQPLVTDVRPFGYDRSV